MENAVVYARFSSHSQTEQSIEGQLNAAHAYAQAKGYNIIHEYCDRAKTGTNDNREEFQQMLSDCAKKQFSVIIVWKVDRFGRNRQEITFNKYRAKRHGVRIEYIAETISEGPEGVILEAVLEGMAEYYSLQLSQNIKRGKLESAKKHKLVNGKAPIGYRRSEDGGYEIDPEGAKTVQIIYQMYAEGKTMSQIVRYLNAHGYKTSRGNNFTKNSVPLILNNENYIGTYHYLDLVEEDAIPAIIDMETYLKVQEMKELNQHRTVQNWTYDEYLLSGKMICGECGAPYIGEGGTSKTGRKYNYYVCSNRHYNKGCKSRRFRREEIEEKILDYVRTAILTDDGIEEMTNIILDYYAEEDATTQEIIRLKKEREQVGSAYANLVKAIESGLDFNSVEARLKELQLRRIQLNGLICNLELARPLSLTRSDIVDFLEKFRDSKIKDRECDKRLLSTFVNSVLVKECHLVISFNIGNTAEPVFKDIVLPCALEWSETPYVRTIYRHTYCVTLPITE